MSRENQNFPGKLTTSRKKNCRRRLRYRREGVTVTSGENLIGTGAGGWKRREEISPRNEKEEEIPGETPQSNGKGKTCGRARGGSLPGRKINPTRKNQKKISGGEKTARENHPFLIEHDMEKVKNH